MPGSEISFGARLSSVFARHGQLCVGIDPHSHLLAEWGLTDTADGVREFGLRVVDAAEGRVGVIKPQVAFFERHGSAGFAALERVISAARASGLLVIADAKRGDIGSTMSAYAESWLEPGSALESDALTVNPFLGVGSLAGTAQMAIRNGKGLFVLAATSNQEAIELQSARVGQGTGVSLSSSIVNDVVAMNRSAETPLASVGLVLGATADLAAAGIDLDAIASQPATPVLAPGFGTQGAKFSDLGAILGPAAKVSVVAVSRSLLSAGPEQLPEAITRQAGELAECLG